MPYTVHGLPGQPSNHLFLSGNLADVAILVTKGAESTVPFTVVEQDMQGNALDMSTYIVIDGVLYVAVADNALDELDA